MNLSDNPCRGEFCLGSAALYEVAKTSGCQIERGVDLSIPETGFDDEDLPSKLGPDNFIMLRIDCAFGRCIFRLTPNLISCDQNVAFLLSCCMRCLKASTYLDVKKKRTASKYVSAI